MHLDRFFDTMRPFLAGEIGTDGVAAALGPSASGPDALAFYQILAGRNVFKAMRELYPSLPVLANRVRAGLWSELVEAYSRRYPPGGRHPDAIGCRFAEFLAELQAQDDPTIPSWLPECADIHACQLRAGTAPEDADVDDGIDVRLFVRQYQYPVLRVIGDVRHVDLDRLQPSPSPVLIFRSWRDRCVYTVQPNPTDLFALGRRQSLPITSVLGATSSDALDAAERALIAKGVLRPRTIP